MSESNPKFDDFLDQQFRCLTNLLRGGGGVKNCQLTNSLTLRDIIDPAWLEILNILLFKKVGQTLLISILHLRLSNKKKLTVVY